MTIARLAGNMLYLATMPSCAFYLRPFGNPSGGTIFKDWSLNKVTFTKSGTVVNTTSNIMYPPAAINFDGSTGYLYFSNAGKTVLGANRFLFHAVLRPAFTTPAANFFQHGVSGGPSGNGALLLGIGSSTLLTCLYSTTGSSWDNIGSYQCTVSGWKTTGKNTVDIIRGATTLTAYFNGVQVGQWSPGSTALYNGGTSYIGAYQDYPVVNFYGGNLDEFALWNAGYGVIPTLGDVYNLSGTALPQTRRLIVG